MSTTTQRPTPETDAAAFDIPHHGGDGTGSRVAVVHYQVARRLERERDEALALLAQYSAEREHNAMQALAYKAERDEAIATCQELVTDSNAVTLAATVVRLERERNEAREALSGRTVSCSQCNEAAAKLSTVYRWIERNHPDGFIDSQSHLQNLDRVADAWHDKLEAMREAIREAHDALKQWPKAGHGMSTDFTKQSEAFRKGQAALVKLQTFLKP